MESLNMKTENLITRLKNTPSPGAQSTLLSSYISDTLKHEQITIYEAYLLKAEDLSLQRKAYTQPAWNETVIIGNLLEILNMRLLSFLVQPDISEDFMLKQALEAYQMNKEVRPHYIVDEYVHFLNAHSDKKYLEKLLEMRESSKKPTAKGPYHSHLFPYDVCKYEALLLNNDSIVNHEVSADVENILVELYLLE